MSLGMCITLLLALILVALLIAFIYTLADFLTSKNLNKDIVKSQIMFVSKEIEDFALSFPQSIMIEGYKTLYTVEMVKNKVIEWICSNDICYDDISIKNKQDEIWSVIHSIPHNESFHSEEFRNKCDKKVQEVMRTLMLMGKR